MKKSQLLSITIALLFSINVHAQVPADVTQDPSLTYCTDDASCETALPGQKKGCFRMTEDDLFSGEAQNPNQFLTLSNQQDSVDEDRELNGVDVDDEDRDGLKDGSACTSSSKCDSYFCDPIAKICKEKRICRYGDLGEAVAAGVACEEGYIINAQGLCDLSEEDKRLYYMGLIEGDVELKKNNSCNIREIQNNPAMEEIRQKSIVSMKTLRAMEWLFATSSLEEKDECLKVLPFMRDEMAMKYNEARKKILTNFNIEMARIEKDSQTILNAKKDSEAMVEVHGKQIKEKDLEGRKHSGYDAMVIMWRRNLLFQTYEKSMSEIIKAAGAKVGGLAEEMGKWTDKSKKWTVGGKEWTYKTAGKCRGKKGKKIKKRWANYYQVKATTPENAEVVNRPAISDYLSLVSGESKDAVKKVLTSGPKEARFAQYFLMDPLMPGGKSTNFEGFGQGKKGKRFLGQNAYPQLYKTFRERIVEFYKGMKGSNAPDGFVYEPEIISVEARDCMEKPEGKNCGLYTQFIDEMTNIAFAQFLAYSIHSKNSYKKYFPKGDNLRRKLLAKYEVDMQNVAKYYDSMVKSRDDQSKCLEMSINSIAEQFIGGAVGVDEDTTESTSTSGDSTGTATSTGELSSFTTGSSAINPNGVYSFDNNSSGSSVDNEGHDLLGGSSLTALPTGNNVNGNVSQLAPRVSRLSSSGLLVGESTRLAFQPNLIASSRNGASGTAGSATLGVSSDQMAARLANMKKANALAVSSRVDIASKEEMVEPAFSNLSRTFGSGSSRSMDGTQVASLGFSGSGSAGLNEISGSNSSKATAVDLRAPVVEMKSGNTVTSPYSSMSPNYAPRTADGKSAPVMSNEDIENIEANYDRSKSHYAPNEGDELFEKVSKAYIRNLDRILVRKKVGSGE